MSEYLPSIFIARRDLAHLERLATSALRERNPVGRFLMSEIRRAVLCDDGKMPRQRCMSQRVGDVSDRWQ